jgi:hypothetical protein
VGFAAASDGHRTAVLATPHAPLLTVGDVFTGRWRKHLDGARGRLFAYVFNNYWSTNYKAAQGGDLLFAFSLDLRRGAFDPAAATRFGWERAEAMGDPRAAAGPRPWDVADQDARPAHMPAQPEGSALVVTSSRRGKTPAVVGGLWWDAGAKGAGGGLSVRLYNPSLRLARVLVGPPGGPAAEAAIPARGVRSVCLPP